MSIFDRLIAASTVEDADPLDRLDLIEISRLIYVCRELNYIYEDSVPGTVWGRFKERLEVIENDS